MGRPPLDPATRLGQAMQVRRGAVPGAVIAAELGVSKTTWHRLERGSQPALPTAQILARWLGWTLDEVVAAATTDVSP